MHKTPVALLRFFGHWVIFVQVERDDIMKTQTFFFVHTHQFLIYFDGGAACCETQHRQFPILLPLPDSECNGTGHMTGRFH